MIITKEYKDRLLFNKAYHSLFIEYELDQNNQLDNEEDFDEKLY